MPSFLNAFAYNVVHAAAIVFLSKTNFAPLTEQR